MFNLTRFATITLGWVVLDRPDQSGLYIAKDLSGGWAYLVADEDGDTRHRGQGACAGGVDVALRCAFLSAVGCVPDCERLTILVDTRAGHRAMVRLAVADPQVIATIAGRPVSIMTRPQERWTLQVQAAAERAASRALRERERDEWHDRPLRPGSIIETTDIREGAAAEVELAASLGWRERQAASRIAMEQNERAGSPGSVPASSPVPRTTVPRRTAMIEWLRDFDRSVAHLATDLKDMGAE